MRGRGVVKLNQLAANFSHSHISIIKLRFTHSLINLYITNFRNVLLHNNNILYGDYNSSL
jgi:hypothetical protein